MNNAQVNRIVTKVDIILHIDEQLDEQNRRRVEYAIMKTAGVERAHFNDERQHLLIVGYDPAQTSSSHILRLVRQHQLNVQLIGGL